MGLDPFAPLRMMGAVILGMLSAFVFWKHLIPAMNSLALAIMNKVLILFEVAEKQIVKISRHIRFASIVRTKAKQLGVSTSDLWEVVDSMVATGDCSVPWALFQINDPDLVHEQGSRDSKI